MDEVTIYTTSWCPYCKQAKAAFDAQGVRYHEIDIEQHAEWAPKLEAWNGGNRTVPTFAVGEEIVTYADRARLQELVGVHIA